MLRTSTPGEERHIGCNRTKPGFGSAFLSFGIAHVIGSYCLAKSVLDRISLAVSFDRIVMVVYMDEAYIA
jgi:hypothetical protein